MNRKKKQFLKEEGLETDIFFPLWFCFAGWLARFSTQITVKIVHKWKTKRKNKTKSSHRILVLQKKNHSDLNRNFERLIVSCSCGRIKNRKIKGHGVCRKECTFIIYCYQYLPTAVFMKQISNKIMYLELSSCDNIHIAYSNLL